MQRVRDFLDYLWPAPVQEILRELLITVTVLGAILLVAQPHQPPRQRPAVRNMPYVRHIRLLPYVMQPSPPRAQPAPAAGPHR